MSRSGSCGAGRSCRDSGADRDARQGSQGGRPVHTGVDSSGPQRSANRDGIRGREAAGPGSGCVLAGAGAADGDSDAVEVVDEVAAFAIAHARSGDKGDTANVGYRLRRPAYPVLVREVTAERVKSFFGNMVQGEVTRYALPNLGALNFLMQRRWMAGERYRFGPMLRARRTAPHCFEWRSRLLRPNLIDVSREERVLRVTLNRRTSATLCRTSCAERSSLRWRTPSRTRGKLDSARRERRCLLRGHGSRRGDRPGAVSSTAVHERLFTMGSWTRKPIVVAVNGPALGGGPG